MADEWETCEITVVTTETDGCRAHFWAKASSPDGPYNAGESNEFVCTLPVKADRQAQAELQALIRRLIDEGWDTDPLQEVEPHWYSLHLRRRIIPLPMATTQPMTVPPEKG